MTVYGGYQDLRLDGMQGRLIFVPPTWHKGWDLAHPVSAVWDAAREALRTARRIIIIGYSVPATDLHFKYLLAAGFQENAWLSKVFFVNPDLGEGKAGRAELLRRLLSPSGLLRDERFRQGFIDIVPANTREFFDTTPLDIPVDARLEKPRRYRVRIGRPLSPLSFDWQSAPLVVFDVHNGYAAH